MSKEISNQSSKRHQARDIMKRERRTAVAGYPRATPFKTPAEVYEYLSQDEIDCLICGRRMAALPAHLAKIHRMSSDEYRERYGLPFRRGLTSNGFKENMRRVRDKDSAKTRAARLKNLMSSDVREAAATAAHGQRKSGLKLLTSMSSLGRVRPDARALPKQVIEQVVIAVEQGEMLGYYLDRTKLLSPTAFRSGLKRHPDLKARYEAVAGKARSAHMQGNTLWKGGR